MIVRNHLSHLTADTEHAARILIARLRNKGLSPHLQETYRTPERQRELWNTSQNLVKEGKAPLTKTLHSWHETGRAIDFYISPADMQSILFFLDTARNIGFETMQDPDEVRAELARGERPNLWDWHHVEWRAGRTWPQAFAEYSELKRGTQTSGLGTIIGAGLAIGTIGSMLRNE